MNHRSLGAAGPEVSAIGLGCMGMSDFYGPTDRGESIATIHAALDAGITLLDTGDFYGMGHNEMLIREALAGRDRDSVDHQREIRRLARSGGELAGYDARPLAVKNFLAYSLRRLGTDYIDIYRPSRLDSDRADRGYDRGDRRLVKAGYVRYVGLSEVGADTIRRAAAVHPISDLQIEFSLISRGIEERDPAHLPRARHRHHRLWRALARADQRTLVKGPRRRVRLPGQCPRFQGANLEANLALVESAAGKSPRGSEPRWRRSPSPGWRRKDRTSSRWSAPGGAIVSPRPRARSTSRFRR